MITQEYRRSVKNRFRRILLHHGLLASRATRCGNEAIKSRCEIAIGIKLAEISVRDQKVRCHWRLCKGEVLSNYHFYRSGGEQHPVFRTQASAFDCRVRCLILCTEFQVWFLKIFAVDPKYAALSLKAPLVPFASAYLLLIRAFYSMLMDGLFTTQLLWFALLAKHNPSQPRKQE